MPDSIDPNQNPDKIRDVDLPRRESFYPSPIAWQDEILYFMLVDRFSDGKESSRTLLDRGKLTEARLDERLAGEQYFRFDRWAESGGDRWQGGTLQGVISKLDYLQQLGVTAIWLSPIFKQRGHLNTFHGYGIQNFLDVDPHFGARQDLIDLVQAAHAKNIRIILDIIFNHSGHNWNYPAGTPGGTVEPTYTTGHYSFGQWLGDQGQEITAINGPEDGVWPDELQGADCYTRAGTGDLGAGDLDDPNAEHKRTDFRNLRDFQLTTPGVLSDLARCFKYWIALTDCDGFRIDTVKHVSFEEARNFCGTVKEFAANLGKKNFFLVGEVAGGDYAEDRYLDILGQNLNAALDIGEMRLNLNALAKGLVHPDAYFSGFDPGRAVMGSHRNLGERHVSILDDHDHVFGQKLRFSTEAASDHQVVAGTALQLLSLGIPCIYYGTEQAFAGPELSEREWVPGFGSNDRFLREAMFGPKHPRKAGRDGLPSAPDGEDTNLHGFGPFGAAGRHCFDPGHPAFVRIAAINALRQQIPALRSGRQYLRPISFLGKPFGVYGPGEIVAWARVLDDEEIVCIINAHGVERRGADVLVDASLSPPGSALKVALNTAQAANPGGSTSHPVGSLLPVRRIGGGPAFIEIRNLGPSEALVLINKF